MGWINFSVIVGFASLRIVLGIAGTIGRMVGTGARAGSLEAAGGVPRVVVDVPVTWEGLCGTSEADAFSWRSRVEDVGVSDGLTLVGCDCEVIGVDGPSAVSTDEPLL